MLKVWGAGLIIIAAFCVVIIQQREHTIQHKQLCRWVKLLELLESEIRWHRVSLIEFFEKQSLTTDISEYLKSKNTLQQSWTIIVENIGDNELSEILKDLHFSGDRESLLNSISYAAERLRTLDDHRCFEAGKTKKIQSAAYLSGAGLLIILLL